MSEKLTRSDVILICEKLAEDAIDEQNIEKAQGVTTVETDIISHMTTGKTAEQALLSILYKSLKGIVPSKNPKLQGIIQTLGKLVEENNKHGN